MPDGSRRRVEVWLCGFVVLVSAGGAHAGPTGERSWDSLRQRAFRRYDVDGDGRLSPDELGAARTDLSRLGIEESPETMQRYVREHDLDGDGMLNEQEVKRAPLPGGIEPSTLKPDQRRKLERLLRAYQAAESTRRVWERAAQSIPEVLALAVLTLLPTGLLVTRWQVLAEERGWRRPTWRAVALVYGVLLVMVVWVYFAFLPSVW